MRGRHARRAFSRPWHLALAKGCPSTFQAGGLHAQDLGSRRLFCHIPDPPTASCTQVSLRLLLRMRTWPDWRLVGLLLLVMRLLVAMLSLGRCLRLGPCRGRLGGPTNIITGGPGQHRSVSMALWAGRLLP